MKPEPAQKLPIGPTRPITISPGLAAKCDGPNQFETFDRGVRAFLAIPKSALLKDEARDKQRKERAKK